MEKIKVSLMAGKQAGCVGLLCLYAARCEILCVVAYDELVKHVAKKLDLPTFSSIKDDECIEVLNNCDLLVSVHGREIVPGELLKIPPLGCINVHPCLYKYKGRNPVARLLEDNIPKASVGVHYMLEEVDAGEVIVELFVDVSGKNTVEEVYNALYPYYIVTLLEAINKIRDTVC